MFVKGLDPAQGIFNPAAAASTTTNVVCSARQDFSSPLTGTSCVSSNDTIHRYYGHASFSINRALYAGGPAYALCHCEPVGTGYFNRGAIWFR